MFEFVLNTRSKALLRMKTLVSPKTTNLAAALATAAAFARVKRNYPKVWRDALRGAEGGERTEMTPDTIWRWQDFKEAHSKWGNVPGFLTGTTWKSIRYKMRGKGKGEIFLEGRWPNFGVQDWFVEVNGKRIWSGTQQSGWTQISMEGMPRPWARKLVDPTAGYREAVNKEDVIAEEIYGDEAREVAMDLGEIRAQFEKVYMRRSGGKKIPTVTGVIAARWGREEMIWIDAKGLRYRHLGYQYFVPSESYRSKKFGTSRGRMFQGGAPPLDEWSRVGAKQGWGRPIQGASPVNVLRLRQTQRTKDVDRVVLQVEAFYYKLLKKK